MTLVSELVHVILLCCVHAPAGVTDALISTLPPADALSGAVTLIPVGLTGSFVTVTATVFVILSAVIRCYRCHLDIVRLKCRRALISRNRNRANLCFVTVKIQEQLCR